MSRCRQWRGDGFDASLQLLERDFDPLIALRHLGLVEVVQGHGLGELEHVLGLVMTAQRFTDCLDGGFAAHVAMLCKDIGIALTRDDRPDDLHAGDACDVLNDVMQLYIHLHHCLLHMLDMGRRIFQQALPLPQIGS